MLQEDVRKPSPQRARSSACPAPHRVGGSYLPRIRAADHDVPGTPHRLQEPLTRDPAAAQDPATRGCRAAQLASVSTPSSISLSVSPRSPSRSVSSGITSSGGMLPRFTFGAEVLHEPRLRRLRRRLEEDVVDRHAVGDLVDQARAHVAVLAEDAGGAALAGLRDHLPGAGLELLLDPLAPTGRARRRPRSPSSRPRRAR